MNKKINDPFVNKEYFNKKYKLGKPITIEKLYKDILKKINATRLQKND